MEEVTRRGIPGVRDSLLDKAIGFISPERAVRRRRARAVLAITGGYDGGRSDRRGLKAYNPLGGSADADISAYLPTLRQRSRYLARNNPIAGGAVHTVVNNVVGTGLRLNSGVDREALGMTAEEAKRFQQDAERYFRAWCEECDLERGQTFFDIQDLAFRSTLESGDMVALLPFKKRPGDAFGLKVQLVEGDRLSNPNHRGNTATLSDGVELDADGAPVQYHISTYHPGDIAGGLKREWKAYPAFTASGRRAALHLYRKLRPGQHRGVPYLAPVIETVKQLGRYTEAEVMAAVVSGMFTVFTYTENAEGINTDELVASDGRTKSVDGDMDLGYGAIVDLNKGERVETANPGRPNQAFDPFVMAVCRQIGMALELPYEVLVKHFTASYSAARAALLEAWTFYKGRRAWLVRQFCAPVYEAWMWEAVARGLLYAPGFTTDPFIRRAYLQAEWIGPTQAQIDPVKEVEAAGKRIELKLTTRSEECQALIGNDWENKVSQIKYEEELVGGMTPTEGAPKEAEKEEDDGDEGDEEE